MPEPSDVKYARSAQVYRLGFAKVFPTLNPAKMDWLGAVDAELTRRFEELYNSLTDFDWQQVEISRPVSLLARYRPRESSRNAEQRYFPVKSLFDKGLHYPSEVKGLATAEEILALQRSLEQELEDLPQELALEDSGRLSSRVVRLLAEKYLSAVGVEAELKEFEQTSEILPLYDILQLCAAILSQPEGTEFHLAILDISGIQEFAYNIANSRALLSLRGRSAFLEILSRIILRQLLDAAGATEDCLLIPGGGYYSLLLPAHKKDLANELEKIIRGWNANLFHWQEGRLAAVFAMSSPERLLTAEDLLTKNDFYSRVLDDVAGKLQAAKWSKFSELLTSKELANQSPGEPCSICRRHVADDSKLKPVKSSNSNDDNPINACDLCHFLIALGRSINKPAKNDKKLHKKISFTINFVANKWQITDIIDARSVELHTKVETNLKTPLRIAFNPLKATDLLETDLEIRLAFSDLNTAKESPATNVADAAKDEEEPSHERLSFLVPDKGWQGQAAIRADVDNLGSLLMNNLPDLPVVGLISLSRLLTLFFSTYIMRLDNGEIGVEQFRLKHAGLIKDLPKLTERKFQLIYGGGDDLFGLGAWDDVVEFAFDIGREWRKFTSFNPHATLSAGVHLHDSKYPVSVRAYDAGKLLDKAKDNQRPGKSGSTKKEKEKDSLYLSMARLPLFWDELLPATENGTEPLTPKSSEITPARIRGEFLIPLYRLLDSEAVPRSFVRKLLDAEREMHDNNGKNQPQGKVSLLYLLASCREREALKDHEVWKEDWGNVFRFLMDIHQTPNPPELLLYLNWLDLAARPPRETRKD